MTPSSLGAHVRLDRDSLIPMIASVGLRRNRLGSCAPGRFSPPTRSGVGIGIFQGSFDDRMRIVMTPDPALAVGGA